MKINPIYTHTGNVQFKKVESSYQNTYYLKETSNNQVAFQGSGIEFIKKLFVKKNNFNRDFIPRNQEHLLEYLAEHSHLRAYSSALKHGFVEVAVYKKGKTLQEFLFSKGGQVLDQVHQYHDNGVRVKKSTYMDSGKIDYVNFFNSKGNNVRSDYYKKGVLEHSQNYDQSGRELVNMVYYKSDGKTVEFVQENCFSQLEDMD